MSPQARFQPGYYRTFGGEDPTATVYGFLLGALYPIKSWLTARLDYRFAYQKQADDPAHNIVTLSLTSCIRSASRRSGQDAAPLGPLCRRLVGGRLKPTHLPARPAPRDGAFSVDWARTPRV